MDNFPERHKLLKLSQGKKKWVTPIALYLLQGEAGERYKGGRKLQRVMDIQIMVSQIYIYNTGDMCALNM